MEAPPEGSVDLSDGNDNASERSRGYASSGASNGEDAFVGCESNGVSDASEKADDDDDAADEEGHSSASEGELGAVGNITICSLCEGDLRFGPADETLQCDGGCLGLDGKPRHFDANETVLSCAQGCDFDICTGCAKVPRPAAMAAGAAFCELPHPSQVSQEPVTSGEPARAQPAGAQPSALDAQLARIRERIAQRRTRQPEDMSAFRTWQADKAEAARRAALGGDDTNADGRITASSAGTIADTLEPEARLRTAVATTATTPTTDYNLSPPPAWPPTWSTRAELHEQVATLLAGGDETRLRALEFAREVFRQAPSAQIDSAFDAFDDIRAARRGAASTSSPRRFQVAVDKTTRATLPLAAVTYQTRCLCCDGQVGEGDVGKCDALRMLDSLEEDMLERDRLIEHELDMGEDIDRAHRGARFAMYRMFVAARYGHLGQGNRVKIPECVVAAIRSRFRAWGCDCDVSELARCTSHGYKGHRDAR